MAVKTKKKAKRKVPFVVIFWILFFAIMALAFLINKKRIQETWTKVFGEVAAESEAPLRINEEAPPEYTAPPAEGYGSEYPPPPIESNSADEISALLEEGAAEREALAAAEKEQGFYSDEGEIIVPAPVQKLVERNLFFVDVDSGGMVLITPAPRAMPATSSPLRDTLTMLLEGPLPKEKKEGMRTLIPEATRLLSVRVEGSTAIINFSEDFMFNVNGAEGYIAQIKQVVWTATEFNNINNVQILIDGKKHDFLGDYIRIDKPVSRNSY